MEQVLKLFGTAGDSREMGRKLVMGLGVPLTAFVIFLILWSFSAARIQTSLGAVPGPVQVLELELVQEREQALVQLWEPRWHRRNRQQL